MLLGPVEGDLVDADRLAEGQHLQELLLPRPVYSLQPVHHIVGVGVSEQGNGSGEGRRPTW